MPRLDASNTAARPIVLPLIFIISSLFVGLIVEALFDPRDSGFAAARTVASGFAVQQRRDRGSPGSVRPAREIHVMQPRRHIREAPPSGSAVSVTRRARH